MNKSKYIRLGYGETSLLFINWIENNKWDKISDFDKRQLIKSKTTLINWLYTTSGYYDSSISGTYFDFDAKKAENESYKRYMKLLYEASSNAYVLQLCFHNFEETIKAYKDEFYKSFNAKKHEPIGIRHVCELVDNKRVLVISSFANLVKQQIVSGNHKKIHNIYPPILDVITYTTPYTFFNSGPDGHMLNTLEKIKQDIKQLRDQFDVAIISFGSYTALLADYIYQELDKSVLCIGRMLQVVFGIKTSRTITESMKNPEYWIPVPDEYKPPNYQKIENGCYW